MKTLVVLLVFAVALGFSLKVARGAQEDAVFDGDYVYDVNCSGCHGDTGGGVFLFGPPLKGDGFITKGDDKSIASVIQMGRKYRAKMYKDYMGMPRFQFIRAAEMDALIAYLKGGLQTTTAEPLER